ncbi:hypothetical protein DWX10_18155 [Clostridium sp. AF18-27]|uniref:hypothetical protein n=1 Tax=Enterocloster lavalensis TaxID=460384 RepID=UPI000E543C0A|nr:hypothetical protein [Enterocloster lavalensis]RHR51494.1 hypothetical protein DWX10_18155 [Clostridium sp. AF18-27]
MDKYREYLPQSWLAFIDRDPVLAAAFSAHIYACDSEPVAPFLFQDLRGGEMERLRPIFALYGQPGLNLLRQLQEIDTRTRDTAQTIISGGQTAYAGYFFTRPEIDVQAAREAAKDYIRAVNRIFEEELGKPQLLDGDAEIEFPTGGEAAAIEEELRQTWIHGADIPELDVREGLGDWFMDLEYQENLEELAELLSEPLYHISNDYFLSYYLQWPLLNGAPEDNPFLPHYRLWCMGLSARFPARDRVVLLR